MYVIKRNSKREKFNGVKLYKSIHNACLSAEMNEKMAKVVSRDVMTGVQKLVKGKKEVESDAIFKHVKKLLSKHNKECAFMYESFRDIS